LQGSPYIRRVKL